MPRDNLRDALRLAQAGLKVIPLHTAVEGRCDCNRTPCPSAAKHPWLTDWVNGASDELNTILEWWKARPAANVGVACGQSGVVVIDVDPRHGGEDTIEAWVREHGPLPEGPRVVTGGGGMHFYFQHPGGRIQSRPVAPGIDCKADGGQVVAPPSVHASGMPYRWVDGFGPERPKPALPDWLLAICRRPDLTRTADGTGMAPLPDIIPEHHRHDWLFKWACSMREKGASQEVLFQSLMALNQERCRPMLDRSEVAELAADVAKRYTPGSAFVFVAGQKTERRERLTGEQVIAEKSPYRLSEIQFLELPPVRWAVPELVPEGLMILVGPIKQGKSWWALQTAVAVAMGDIVYDALSVDDGDVLYLALEDSRRRMKTRGDALLKDERRWPDRIEVVDMDTGWPTATSGGCDAIEAWLGQHPDARLVVIDTLQKFRGHDANPRRNSSAYAQDYEAMRPLHEIANRHHVAIVMIHHMNKALHDDWVDKISGTTAIGGAADTLSALTSPRGKAGMQDGRWRITGRDVDQQDYSMAFEHGRWRITGNREDGAKADTNTPRFRRLLEHMSLRPWEKYGIREVQAALGCPTYDAARTLLNEALAAGLIRKAGRGEYRLPETEETSSYIHSLRFASVESETEVNRSTEVTEAPKEPKCDLPISLRGKACPVCGASEPWIWTGHGWLCGVCRPHLQAVK